MRAAGRAGRRSPPWSCNCIGVVRSPTPSASCPRRVGAPGRELAAAIATADRDGLPLAPVLDRLAADARAARRRSGEAAARRLPVQLSFPLVVCTLPSFVLLAIAPAVLGALSTLRGRAP